MGNEFNSTFFCKHWSSSQLFYSSCNKFAIKLSQFYQQDYFFCISFPWLISLQLEENYFGSTFYFLPSLICFTLFSFIPSSIPSFSGIWMNIQDTFWNKDGTIWLWWLHRAKAWRQLVLSHPSCDHVPVRIHVQLSSPPLLIWNW